MIVKSNQNRTFRQLVGGTKPGSVHFWVWVSRLDFLRSGYFFLVCSTTTCSTTVTWSVSLSLSHDLSNVADMSGVTMGWGQRRFGKWVTPPPPSALSQLMKPMMSRGQNQRSYLLHYRVPPSLWAVTHPDRSFASSCQFHLNLPATASLSL